MVAVPRVFKENILEHVSGIGPAQDRIDILVAVVIEVAKGHAVPLLQMAEAAGGGNVLKEAPGGIAEHAVGHDRAQRRRPRAGVKIQPAVVVEVAEIATHRVEHLVNARFRAALGKSSVAVVAV